MNTIIEEIIEHNPNIKLKENGLPEWICPDDLGYLALCEDFDITKQLCEECWKQQSKKE